MKDPVMAKLRADAGEVFRGLWRLLVHQPDRSRFGEDEGDDNPGHSNPMCVAFRREFDLPEPVARRPEARR